MNTKIRISQCHCPGCRDEDFTARHWIIRGPELPPTPENRDLHPIVIIKTNHEAAIQEASNLLERLTK